MKKVLSMRNSSIAALLAAAMLAGCSGGGSKVASAVPPTQQGPTSNIKLTVNVGGISVQGQKKPQFLTGLPTGSITVTAAPVAGSGSIYAPQTFCQNLSANVFVYTISIPAPIGFDTIKVVQNTGACSGSGGVGSSGTGAVAQTGALNGGAAVQVTSAGIASPAGPYTITLAANNATTAAANTFNVVQTSGATTTTVANFVMETKPVLVAGIGAAKVQAFPLNFAVTDGNGNTQTTPAGSACTVVSAGSATCNGLSTTLQIKSNNPHVYVVQVTTSTGAVIATSFPATNITTGTTLAINSAPQPDTSFALVYDGSDQDAFTGASVTLSDQAGVVGTIATIAVTAQSQTTGKSLALNPALAFAVPATTAAALGTAAGATEIYVADATNVKQGGVTAAATTAITGITGPAGGLAINTVPTGGLGGNLLITDSGGSGTGLIETPLAATGAVGAFASVATIAGDVATFDNTIGVGVPIGPAGICADPGRPNFFYVMANNSVYVLNLSTSAINGQAYLVAGSGAATGGFTGSGYANGTGNNARFNFGNRAFIGCVTNGDSAHAATTLYVADWGNNAVRAVSLPTAANFGTASAVYGTVTNYSSQAFTGPTGLAYDPNYGLTVGGTGSTGKAGALFVNTAVSSTGGVADDVFVIPNGGASFSLYAGKNAAGATDGLALSTFPLQFTAGNPIANATNTGAATLYASIPGISAGTNAAAQVAGTYTTASFTTPQGIVYDSPAVAAGPPAIVNNNAPVAGPGSSFLYVVDNQLALRQLI